MLLVGLTVLNTTSGIPLGGGDNELQLTPAGSYCECGYNDCGCLGIQYPDRPDPDDLPTAVPLVTPVVTVPVGNLPLLTPVPQPTAQTPPTVFPTPTLATFPSPTPTIPTGGP